MPPWDGRLCAVRGGAMRLAVPNTCPSWPVPGHRQAALALVAGWTARLSHRGAYCVGSEYGVLAVVADDGSGALRE
jgi:hypothetical protein